ncbi:MAG: hypothetical protein U0939_06810 [Pirellulales bacterium]
MTAATNRIPAETTAARDDDDGSCIHAVCAAAMPRNSTKPQHSDSGRDTQLDRLHSRWWWFAAICLAVLGCREALPHWQQAWTQQQPLHVQLSAVEHRWRVTRSALGDADLQNVALGEQTPAGLTLYVPVDTPLVLALKSEDYIYSLGIPDLGLKEMAVPGLEFKLNLRPMQVGQYALEGGELCGDPGIPVPGRLVVESREAFVQRLKARRP